MNTVIFDLDGCLSANPYDSPGIAGFIANPDFWHRHWTGTPWRHQEMIELYHSLTFWRRIILTARPHTYAKDTLRWLRHHNIDTALAYPGEVTVDSGDCLVMSPSTEIVPSGPWKYSVIEQWVEEGMRPQFAVEDCKTNADMIRRLLPVLLYERKK